MREEGGSRTSFNDLNSVSYGKVCYSLFFSKKQRSKEAYRSTSSSGQSLFFPLLHFLSCFERPLPSNYRNDPCAYPAHACEGIRRGREKKVRKRK